MEALYWQPPPAAELAVYGLKPEDYPPPQIDLWEENWPAVALFNKLNGQWRMGPHGPIALDYIVVFHELDRMELSKDGYDDLFGCVRVLEEAALRILK